jgi:4-hydroxymandelate oxidase
VNFENLELKAKERLPAHIHAAIASGVGGSLAFNRNLGAWGRIQLVPHVLTGADVVSPATTVLGTEVSTPVLLAPAGLPNDAHPDGEVAVALGAKAAGTLMVLSHFSTRTLEDVAVADSLRWFQLYITKDRTHCEKLMARARSAGYRAVVITVDSGGGIALEGTTRDPAWDLQPMRGDGILDESITFDDIGWVKRRSGLPVVVKGVVRPDDARRCVDAGADAIIVSNHGGRALDAAVATADALPHVVDAVGGEVEVYVDGGIRHGHDVVKALALGARAVFIGQPWVWAVCAGGQDAVAGVIDGLTREFVAALAMCGISSLEGIDKQILWSEQLREV